MRASVQSGIPMTVHVALRGSSNPVSSTPNNHNRALETLDTSPFQQPLPSPPAPIDNNDHDVCQPLPLTRQPRKPSPGLAARLKALGFGRDSSRRQRSPSESIGRIPEDHIRQLDSVHRANSTKSVILRRGRAWSGTSSASTASSIIAPQIVGDASTGFSVESRATNQHSTAAALLQGDAAVTEVGREILTAVDNVGGVPDMTTYDESMVDPQQKYRLPDHENGNGTKSIPQTRMAHLEREEAPPPPIPANEPSAILESPGDFSNQVQSYFNPLGLQRAGSIYTLSRVSFANQLAQLTSLQLPDAESLSSRVSAIPTSRAAAKALMNAAEQIRSWISKASEVLGGLDADDDVEWAAAGGREGLDDVDNAIVRFEQLITVYVSAIEELQGRDDISSVPSVELKKVVVQVETIMMAWEDMRRTLTGVKGQVGVAIEWEELWDTVLGDIGNEMDILCRLVFEMEEKRHRSLMAEAESEGVDIGELETIVEETPPPKLQAKNRFSVAAGFPMTPNSPSTPAMAQDDSSLLALFARMQPLRASLDFLPMRLSAFHSRADKIFPTACEELERRRDGLEASWKRLEIDAETLRRELGEDRWVLVFRGAGRQAQKMYESVDRSLVKLEEAVEAGGHLKNPTVMGKKMESYESKKLHYGPAIERVLSIIEKGVHDRLTVNGEIVRLHSDMQNKWDALKQKMRELDMVLDNLQADQKSQQLRDSISSLVSNDRSTVGSQNDTPGSSPASSVIMSNLQGGTDPTTPARKGKVRPGLSSLPQPGSRRNSSLPVGSPNVSQMTKKGSATRLSSYGFPNGVASPPPASRGSSATPTGNRLPRPSPSTLDGRPRWNGSVRTEDHSFKPLNSTTPSPLTKPKGGGPPLSHANRSLPHTPLSKDSKIPLRSPLGAGSPSSPKAESTPSRPRNSSRLSFSDRISSPGPYSQHTLSSPATRPRNLKTQASAHNLGASKRASLQPMSSLVNDPLVHPALLNRPASSLAPNRRTSLLPQPHARGRQDSSVTGRESPQAVAGAISAMKRNSSHVSTDSKSSKGAERVVEKAKWR